MKIFFDTEFIEDGKTIDLLSIGLVREDGEELYLENVEADWSKAKPWVRDNVLPTMVGCRIDSHTGAPVQPKSISNVHVRRSALAQRILKFVGPGPEFWAYFAAGYNWVVLCQLYGGMLDLPEDWPIFCRDLKQETTRLGLDMQYLPQLGNVRNTLNYARWLRKAFDAVHAFDAGLGLKASQ